MLSDLKAIVKQGIFLVPALPASEFGTTKTPITMGTTFAKNIYKKKYEGQLSFDEFLSSLNRGMKLLKRGKPQMLDATDSVAMEIALEYNMELVFKQLTVSQEDYD